MLEPSSPHSEATESQIVSRMILEVVAADGQVLEPEVRWLDEHLSLPPGAALALARLPPLTNADLALIRPRARMDALQRAWSVAMVDSDLAPEEEHLLARFAEGLGLSPLEASDAARSRRVVLPLERLGITAPENPALFRFLELCARTDGINKVSHCNFVTESPCSKASLEHWCDLGFHKQGEWNTERFPARHISLTRGRAEGVPWDELVGLTIRDDDAPQAIPISQRVQPHELQHISLSIDPRADMEVIRAALERHGVRFMTPVLTDHDPAGAGLRRMFTATQGRFFVEFAQQVPGEDGQHFDGLCAETIEDLYQALDGADADWASLTPSERAAHTHWLPDHVQLEPAD